MQWNGRTLKRAASTVLRPEESLPTKKGKGFETTGLNSRGSASATGYKAHKFDRFDGSVQPVRYKQARAQQVVTSLQSSLFSLHIRLSPTA